MAGRVIFDEARCKGCELCVKSCPQGILKLAEHINAQGFYPATLADEKKCQGCALCALMCPDVAITVEKEGKKAGKEARS